MHCVSEAITDTARGCSLEVPEPAPGAGQTPGGITGAAPTAGMASAGGTGGGP